MHAYDYEKQRWIEGEPARALLLSQVTQELELLEGPRGREYYESISDPDDCMEFDEYVSLLRGELMKLETRGLRMK